MTRGPQSLAYHNTPAAPVQKKKPGLLQQIGTGVIGAARGAGRLYNSIPAPKDVMPQPRNLWPTPQPAAPAPPASPPEMVGNVPLSPLGSLGRRLIPPAIYTPPRPGTLGHAPPAVEGGSPMLLPQPVYRSDIKPQPPQRQQPAMPPAGGGPASADSDIVHLLPYMPGRQSQGPVLHDALMRYDQQGRRVNSQGQPFAVPDIYRVRSIPQDVDQLRSAEPYRFPEPAETPELNAIRQARIQMEQGANQPPQPSLLGTLTDQIGPPQGPQDQAYWGEASNRLQQQLVAEGQARQRELAEQNAGLRAQSFGRNLLPGTQFEAANMNMPGRPNFWVTQGANAQPAGPAPSAPQVDPARMQQLVAQQQQRDAARQSLREQVQAAGGFPQAPRSGLGGLVDRLLPPRQFDPSTLSAEQRPLYDQLTRMEAAKAKRQRYERGEGEYEGRGKAERDARMAARKELVFEAAKQDREDRRWRMNGGPFWQMQQMQMAQRNPMFAAEMARVNMLNRQGDLSRELRREELQLQRDILRGETDERTQARLDANRLAQANLDLQRSQMQSGNELARMGLTQAQQQANQQMQAAQMQHDERMKQLDQQLAESRSRYGLDQSQQGMQQQLMRQQRRDQLRVQYPQATDEQLEEKLNQEFPPVGPSPTAPAPSAAAPSAVAGASPLPLWAQGKSPQEIVSIATSMGWPDMAINALVQQASGDRTANAQYPGGTGFWNFGAGLSHWMNQIGNLMSPGAPYPSAEAMRPGYVRPNRPRLPMTPEMAEWARRANQG